MLASFTLRPPRLSTAKFQPLGSPSGSSLLHSSPSALIEASELSPLCYQMVNVTLSFFLFLKIMCHQSCVIPMSKTPSRFLSPSSIRPLCSGHTAPVPSVALFPIALSALAPHWPTQQFPPAHLPSLSPLPEHPLPPVPSGKTPLDPAITFSGLAHRFPHPPFSSCQWDPLECLRMCFRSQTCSLKSITLRLLSWKVCGCMGFIWKLWMAGWQRLAPQSWHSSCSWEVGFVKPASRGTNQLAGVCEHKTAFLSTENFGWPRN